jgi:hypothetical protein
LLLLWLLLLLLLWLLQLLLVVGGKAEPLVVNTCKDRLS